MAQITERLMQSILMGRALNLLSFFGREEYRKEKFDRVESREHGNFDCLLKDRHEQDT